MPKFIARYLRTEGQYYILIFDGLDEFGKSEIVRKYLILRYCRNTKAFSWNTFTETLEECNIKFEEGHVASNNGSIEIKMFEGV